MRVIAGKAKGRRLKAPTTSTRPMTDRMRESLFSAMGDLDGARVLDLYAGSGSLGLEALSRGAAKAMFVEKERDAIVRLQDNVAVTGFEDRADVEWCDVRLLLARPADERLDLIFVDPPYSMSAPDVKNDLEALVTGGFLGDEGRIVVHRPVAERLLDPLGLDLIWHRQFGQSQIYIFTHEEEE